MQHLTIVKSNLTGKARLFYNKFGRLVYKDSEVSVYVLLGQAFLDLGITFLGVDFFKISKDVTLANTTSKGWDIFDPLFIIDFFPFRGNFLVFMLYDCAFVVDGEISEHLGHINALK